MAGRGAGIVDGEATVGELTACEARDHHPMLAAGGVAGTEQHGFSGLQLGIDPGKQVGL